MGESSLKFVGNPTSELKSAPNQASVVRKKTPKTHEELKSKYKQLKKKGPAVVKGKDKSDVSVAAATPLPKIDEEDGF